MRETVLKTHGPKGKSDWMCKVVTCFVRADPRLTQVGLGEALVDNDVTDVVNFDDKTWELFEQACLTIRRQDPLFQGVQSALIRAALRYALDK
jgi:hypothetical protein